MNSGVDSTQALDAVELFSHLRLKLAGSMRILELLPAVRSDSIIRCHLKEVLLDQADQTYTYEALSYVWGSPKDTRNILCDGKRLSVTLNCWTGLTAVRRRFHTRFLWVDAICIDQTQNAEALRERNQQVQQMGDVYNRASKVLVWLGPGSSSTREVFTILRTLEKIQALSKRIKPLIPYKITDALLIQPLERSLRDSNGTMDEILDRVEENLMPAFEAAFEQTYPRNFNKHIEVVAILQHPWFTRMWTLQELALAADCDVLRGKSRMGWNGFSYVARVFGHSWLPSDDDLSLIRGRHSLESLMDDVHFGSHDLGNEEFVSRSSYRELLFLSSIMYHQATLPIDKVYSVYSILGFLGISLNDLDYGKKPQDAYQELTESWIRSRKKLSVIVLSAHHGTQENPRWPSWVPDWGLSDAGDPKSHNFLMSGCSGFIELLSDTRTSTDACRASMDSLIHCESLFQRPGQLSVQAMPIGRITERLATCATGNLQPELVFYERFRSMCRHISSMESYPTPEDPLTAFFYCVNYAKSPKEERDSEYFQDFVEYFDLMLYPTCSKKNRDLVESKSSPDAPDRLLDFLDGALVNMMGSSDRRNELRRIWSAGVRCRYSEHQAFFLMDSGYVGNTFHSIREADEIFLVAGCPWPMVLRSCGDGYKFVAPAYVRGVMGGERWGEDPSVLLDISIF